MSESYFRCLSCFNAFPFSCLSGVEKLSETTGLRSDKRCGCVQGGAVLHADPGLLKHSIIIFILLFLIHPELRGQQTNGPLSEERHAQLSMYTLQ